MVHAEKDITMPTKVAKSKSRYVIVRCHDAGVHAGVYVRHEGREVQLKDSRRIWKWSGAASLSELATKGASNVSDCKFSAAVASIILLDACEIISTTPAAEKMIRECPEWTVR